MNPQQPFVAQPQPAPSPMPTPTTSQPKASKKKKVLVILGVVIVAGLIAGLFFWQYRTNQNLKKELSASQAEVAKLQSASSDKETSTASADSTSTAKTYDPAIVAKIDGFDKASDSLKEALVNDFYPTAKKDCDAENANVSADAQISSVMVVRTMVRDEFAAVQFCGSGATSILVKTNSAWKVVGSLGMAPSCSLVDQYKISKDITATCSDDAGNAKEVTYQ